MRDARVEISLRRVADLGALAREVARREGVAEANLRSGSRGWSVSSACKRVCPVAVPQAGSTGAAVARCLGLTPSAVSRRAGGDPGRA